MDSITIKVEDEFAEEIDKAMKPYYSTKTEFIREAIRDKIKNLKDDDTLNQLRVLLEKPNISKLDGKKIRELSKKIIKKNQHK